MAENLQDDLPEHEEHSSVRPAGEYAKTEKAMEMTADLVALLRARGRDSYKQAWQLTKEAEREGLDLSNSAELAGVVKETMLAEMRDGNFLDLRWLGAALGAKLWSLGSEITDNPEWQTAAADGVRKTLDLIEEARQEQLRLEELLSKTDEGDETELKENIEALATKEKKLKHAIEELDTASELISMAIKADPQIATRIEAMKSGKLDVMAFFERNMERLPKMNFTAESKKDGYDPDDGTEKIAE
jgi:hypothetical protein